MHSRLFSRGSSHSDELACPDVPEFPERADLPRLSDQEAEAALALLRLLVAQGQATVYTRPYTPESERPRWNVWGINSGKGHRVELEPWAIGVLSQRDPAGEDPA